MGDASATITVEPFPFGKRFAVTMIDDTDLATHAEIEPVYACLDRSGIRITKTVWPLPAVAPSGPGTTVDRVTDTLANQAYTRFCQRLQSQGFEIAMHTASGGNDTRDRTLQAYDLFERVFGHPPKTNIMHGRNRENIYWGKASIPVPILSHLAPLLDSQPFEGHKPESEYYWGDVCREKTTYVRLFETLDTNTLAFDPATPYHEPTKPDVRWWFSSSYGAGTRLLALLTPRQINRLRAARGASIVHCYCRHYAARSTDGSYHVHPRFQSLANFLTGCSDGWYVPVATLLDRLRAVRNVKEKTEQGRVILTNRGTEEITDLALYVPEGAELSDSNGQILTARRNGYGQVPIGTLRDRCTLSFAPRSGSVRVRCLQTRKPDYWRLSGGMMRRLCWQFLHGRRSRGLSRRPAELPWVAELQNAGG